MLEGTVHTHDVDVTRRFKLSPDNSCTVKAGPVFEPHRLCIGCTDGAGTQAQFCCVLSATSSN